MIGAVVSASGFEALKLRGWRRTTADGHDESTSYLGSNPACKVVDYTDKYSSTQIRFQLAGRLPVQRHLV